MAVLTMYIFYQDITRDDIDISAEAFLHFKALRVKVGESVFLFNGVGDVVEAKVVSIGRRDAQCEVLKRKKTETSALPRLVIGMPKLATLEFVLQKAVEIGVSEIILVIAEYTPIKFDVSVYEAKRDRWLKIMQSACEQSEQLILPKLSCQTYAEYCSMASRRTVYMLHPTAQKELKLTSLAKDIDILVGPEGGWSDSECAAQEDNLFRLGTGILRTDTACMAGLLLCAMSN